jgi:hypothetical protein
MPKDEVCDSVVDLLSVTVKSMGGAEVKVQLDEKNNTVKRLKLAIQDEQGISTFTQQLFLVRPAIKIIWMMVQVEDLEQSRSR